MPRTARSLVAQAALFLLGLVYPDPSVASDLPRFGLQHQVGETPGFEESFTRLHGFVPLYGETDDWLLFGDLLGSIDNRSGVSSSAGLGLRIAPSSRGGVFGIHTHFDYREFEFAGGDHEFHRWGIGVEALGEFWAARGNAYVNASGRRSNGIVVNDEPRFIDRYLLLGTAQNSFAESFHGVDFEISRLVPRPFGLPIDHEIGAGAYYWDTPHSDGNHAPGVKGRVHTWLTDSLVTYVHAAHDRVFDTSVNAGFIWYFGGPSTRPSERVASLGARMATPVQRQYELPVLNYLEEAPALSVFATNPQTGQRLTLTHVDDDAAPGGVGTWEQPFSRLEPASFSGTDIVLVQSGTYRDDFISLSAGQRLLATGPAHFVDTVERGLIQLPGTGLGGFSTILNSPANAITLASDTEVTGFTVSGASGDAIFGTGISNVLLRSNTVLNSGLTGILLEGLAGDGQIVSNAVMDSDLNGLHVTPAQATLTIAGNSFIGNGADGVRLFGETIRGEILANTATGNGRNGISLQSRLPASVELFDNNASENGNDGIRFRGTLAGSVVGNRTDRNGSPGSGTGINIGSGGLFGDLIGNTATANAGYGIIVASVMAEYTVHGHVGSNNVNGNRSGGIRLASQDSGGGVEGDVIGNVTNGNGGGGISIDGGHLARIGGRVSNNVANDNGHQNFVSSQSGIAIDIGSRIDGDISSNTAQRNGSDGISIRLSGPLTSYIGRVLNNFTDENGWDGFGFFAGDDFTGDFTGNQANQNGQYGFATLAGGTVTGTTMGNEASGNGTSDFNGNIAQP